MPGSLHKCILILFVTIGFAVNPGLAQITPKNDSLSNSKEFQRKTEKLKAFIEQDYSKLSELDEDELLERGNKIEYADIPEAITDTLRERYEMDREEVQFGYYLNDGIFEIHLLRRGQVVYFDRWDVKMFDVGFITDNAEELRRYEED